MSPNNSFGRIRTKKRNAEDFKEFIFAAAKILCIPKKENENLAPFMPLY